MSAIPDDRINQLRDKFDEPLPESWIPSGEGDELVGTFVRLERGTTAFGPCWIVVLESARAPGKYASVWLINQALVNAFAKVRPLPGELVGVRYGGKKPVKNPVAGRSKEYHDWKVVVDRTSAAAAPPAWDAVGSNDTHDELLTEPVVSPETAQLVEEPPPYTDDIPF